VFALAVLSRCYHSYSLARPKFLNLQAAEQGGCAAFAGTFGFEQGGDGSELAAEFFAGEFAL
jgi:hypothetical protein